MIIKINLLPQVWITGQSRTPGAQTGGKRVTSESKGKTDKSSLSCKVANNGLL